MSHEELPIHLTRLFLIVFSGALEQQITIVGEWDQTSRTFLVGNCVELCKIGGNHPSWLNNSVFTDET